MAELLDILRLWQQQKQTGDPAVLATVVKTAGSSYRLPGARLLIGQNGQKAGSVSGGCLEDDLLKKAFWLTANGPVIRRYDTTPEGEIGSGYGLGCNGIIHVLLERVTPGAVQFNSLDLIEQVHHFRQPAAICHILDSPGQKLVLHPDGAVSHNLSDESTVQELGELAKAALPSRTPPHGVKPDTAGPSPGVFVETLTPPIRLLIFGAGDDAIPLTGMAVLLGWRTRVLDSRAHYARSEKFPDAEEVCLRPLGTPLPVSIDYWTVAVLMSHSYSQDLDALRTLAAHPPRYLGILGPRKRTETMLAEAGLERSAFHNALYGPTGLDIGADGAHQVALAIVAEIQAVVNGRAGGYLRNAQSSIHADSIHADSMHADLQADSAEGASSGIGIAGIVCA